MIKYSTQKNFEQKVLKELFLSVEWSSGDYPEKLVMAMKNSDKVYSAWDGKKLVGLINALSDKAMTAYFHYLLVHPDYQKQGIGKTLLDYMLNEYKDYSRKVLIAYNTQIDFYKKCEFEVGDDKVPMFVTYLTT